MTVRDDQEPHMLDLILTNEEDMVHQISYSASLGSSDQVCIHFNLTYSASELSKTCIGYNYYKANFDNLRNIRTYLKKLIGTHKYRALIPIQHGMKLVTF